MENISIRRGETLQLPVEADDDSALTVRFVASKVENDQDVIYFDLLESFIDGKATIQTDDTFVPIDEYDFTLTIEYSDGVTDILPDTEECDGECELPKLIICKSNIPEVS